MNDGEEREIFQTGQRKDTNVLALAQGNHEGLYLLERGKEGGDSRNIWKKLISERWADRRFH